MQATNIEWADWTWNPVRGCSRISPGCMNCYAELDMARKNSNPKVPGCHGYAEFRIIGNRREAHWTGKVKLIESKLLEPLSWRRKALRFAQEHGHKPRVFVNSMSDLFHERLPDKAIDRIMAVAALCPQMNFLFLTKRAERMERYLNTEFLSNRIFQEMIDLTPGEGVWAWGGWKEMFAHVWLGVSVEDQKRADERIPHLLRTPAAVRFLSVEPMLEEIRLRQEWATYKMCYACGSSGFVSCDHWRGIDWVICGGESGPGARPFDLAWARSLRDQCKAAGVAFFMKQAGGKPEETVIAPSDGHKWQRAMPLKDKKGGDPAEWPEDLRVQEVPECR